MGQTVAVETKGKRQRTETRKRLILSDGEAQASPHKDLAQPTAASDGDIATQSAAPTKGPIVVIKSASVIFLDIDGVINPLMDVPRRFFDSKFKELFGENAERTNQRCSTVVAHFFPPHTVAALHKLMEEMSAHIVYITNWFGNNQTMDDTREVLGMHPFSAKAIDKIDDGIDSGKSRGERIQDWLDSHPSVKRFIVLDDVDSGLSERFPKNFFKIDHSQLLTNEVVKSVISALHAGSPASSVCDDAKMEDDIVTDPPVTYAFGYLRQATPIFALSREQTEYLGTDDKIFVEGTGLQAPMRVGEAHLYFSCRSMDFTFKKAYSRYVPFSLDTEIKVGEPMVIQTHTDGLGFFPTVASQEVTLTLQNGSNIEKQCQFITEEAKKLGHCIHVSTTDDEDIVLANGSPESSILVFEFFPHNNGVSVAILHNQRLKS